MGIKKELIETEKTTKTHSTKEKIKGENRDPVIGEEGYDWYGKIPERLINIGLSSRKFISVFTTIASEEAEGDVETEDDKDGCGMLYILKKIENRILSLEEDKKSLKQDKKLLKKDKNNLKDEIKALKKKNNKLKGKFN